MAQSNPTNVETIAYVVHNPGDNYKLEEIVLDEVRDDELLIDMKFSGLCHTDAIFQQGDIRICEYPAVFGHEGAGTIRAIGSKVKNKDLKVGDFVLLSINYCEKCEECTTGHPANCHEGTRYHLKGVRTSDNTTAARLKSDGRSVRSHFFGQSSFSKTSVVAETSVVKFPYPAEEAAKFAAMGCGYQTGAGTVLNILKPKPHQSIVIFGMGTVGLTALMAAKSLGMRQIVGVDIQDSKLRMAKEVGATDIINSRNDPDIVKRIIELTSGGANFCIDCTGVLQVIENMISCLAALGTAVTVGVPPSNSKISIDPQAFLLGSRRYMGCREGDSDPPVFIPKLVEMQRQGLFPVEKLITVYDYKDIAKAIDDLHAGNVIKPVIQWS